MERTSCWALAAWTPNNKIITEKHFDIIYIFKKDTNKMDVNVAIPFFGQIILPSILLLGLGLEN
jgi:hypothetical protein